MDFRAASQRLAISYGDEMDGISAMDVDDPPHPWNSFTGPSTDNMDPASPGGPAPYNGADPFGQPVTTDPEWLDPQQEKNRRGQPMPYTPGPNVDTTTLHNARRTAYEAKNVRVVR